MEDQNGTPPPKDALAKDSLAKEPAEDSSLSSSRPKFRRTRWVIDARAQYRMIALGTGGVLVGLLLVYGAALRYHLTVIDYFQSAVAPSKLEQIAFLEGRFAILQKFLGIAFVVLAPIFSYIALQESNRIAGPIYNLVRKIRQFREEGQGHLVVFRRTDYFSELAREYNALVERLSKGRGKSDGDKSNDSARSDDSQS